MKLSETGEDRLLAQLLPALSRNRSVVLGAGDDCAVVRTPRRDNLQLLKTDCIVEGIHFTAASPPALGWLESNGSSVERFRRDVGRPAVCSGHLDRSLGDERSPG